MRGIREIFNAMSDTDRLRLKRLVFFIFCYLFNNVVSKQDYTESNDKMIEEELI
jgi:hypothetical protein